MRGESGGETQTTNRVRLIETDDGDTRNAHKNRQKMLTMYESKRDDSEPKKEKKSKADVTVYEAHKKHERSKKTLFSSGKNTSSEIVEAFKFGHSSNTPRQRE